MKKYFLLTTCCYNIIGGEREQVIATVMCYAKTPADCIFIMYQEDEILFIKKHIENRSILRSEAITKRKAEHLRDKLNMRIYGR